MEVNGSFKNWTVTHKADIEKIQDLLSGNSCYYLRIQDVDYNLGEKSWGMIYGSQEEAIEDGSTILNGKSCVQDLSDLKEYLSSFDDKCVVLLVTGDFVEWGHDDEPVVQIETIEEIYSIQDFYL